MVKETTETKKVETISTKRPTVAGIDIDKLVKKAQDSYDKKENGLAMQLSTGKSITVSEDDADYVVWTGGDHWFKLTHLKGLPMGRIVQISGKPDSGKSTHAAAFMKFAQDQDMLVILWDAERKFARKRFDEKIGGCSDNLLVVNTNKIIDGAKAVANLVHSAKEMNPNIKILICWDSVGASLNSTEDDDDEENYSKQPGVTAKENAYAVRKFNKLINKYMDTATGKHTISILLINQTYASIGMGVSTQIEKGGGEIYYLSSLIVQLSRKQNLTRIRQGEKYKWGIVSVARLKKNHLFDGDECIAEMDLVIAADGIKLAKDVKKFEDISGWNDKDEDGDDE